MSGITFDTGALIAAERRHARIVGVLARARALEVLPTVPAAVLTEWWRGRSEARQRLLRFVAIEPLDASLAQTAGEALAVVKGSSAIDAIVMASAARRGDVVYTSDVDDLVRLQRFFPTVRVLSA